MGSRHGQKTTRLARAAALTPEARSAIARRAAEKRWAGDAAPEAIRDGILKIGDAEFQCFVLADHTRVLARASFVRAIGRTGKVKGGREYDGELQTPVFLTANNLKPFFPSDLEGNSKPILLNHKGVITPYMVQNRRSHSGCSCIPASMPNAVLPVPRQERANSN